MVGKKSDEQKLGLAPALSWTGSRRAQSRRVGDAMQKKWILLPLALVFIGWLTTAFFSVQAHQVGIVTRFSRPLAGTFAPGLHIKAPWPIDAVIPVDQRLLILKYQALTEFLTQDKKNILVDSYALWKISDADRYLATLRLRSNAEARLLDMITAALGEVVGSYPLSSFINPEQGGVKIDEINSEIKELCQKDAMRNYGIDIVDMRINGFNFPAQNRASLIKRMEAERSRIATRYRAEGEEKAQKIRADTELETRSLLAEAKSKAEVTRGEAEAKAMRIYADAYGADPAFYRFMRNLEALDKVVDKDTTIMLPLDAEPWRLLKQDQP